MAFDTMDFGTAGVRALLGEGEGELNVRSVAALTRALVRLLQEKRQPGAAVLLFRDSRRDGVRFVRVAAAVLRQAGYCVYAPPEPAPTPFLSFCIRRMGAAAGINFTASHNPPEYSGFKAYGADGAQLDETDSRRVSAFFHQEQISRPVPQTEAAPLPKRLYADYLRFAAQGISAAGVKVVYTPLAGVGGPYARALFSALDADVVFVEAEMQPDENFSGISRPSPDEPAAFSRALALAANVNAELILANDPDADRLGVMARDGDRFRLLSGGQIGLLLLDFLLERENCAGRLVLKSVVTEPLTAKICAEKGILLQETPVGFRHIAREMGKSPERFLFAFEESGGFLASAALRDKDGISAAALFLAAYGQWKRQGMDAWAALRSLYRRYGEIWMRTETLPMPQTEQRALMQRLRETPPEEIGGRSVTAFHDYSRAGEALRCDLLRFDLTDGAAFFLRPSGTEAKLKLYCNAESEVACAILGQAVRQELLCGDA